MGALGQRLRRQVEQLRLPALHLSIRRAAAHRGRHGFAQRAAGRSSSCPIPAKFFPWRLADENSPERLLTGLDADPESLVTMPDESFWIGDEIRPVAAALLGRRRVVGAARRAAGQPPVGGPSAGHRTGRHPAACRTRAASKPWTSPATTRRWCPFSKARWAGDAPKTLRVQRYDTAAGKWLPGHSYI